MDNDIRNRYRRDFTKENIGRPHARRPAQPQPMKRPVEPTLPKPTAPPLNPAKDTIVRQPVAPEALAAKKVTSKPRLLRKRTLVALSVVIVFFVGLFGAYTFSNRENHKNTAPSTKQNAPIKSISSATAHSATATQTAAQIPSTFYYPSKLPGSYHTDANIQVLNKNTAYYTISDSSGNSYSVTVQPTPANFNQASFTSNFSDVEKLSVNAGSAVIGDNNSELVASIQTSGGSWILVSAASTSLRPQLETIVRSLAAYAK